jgi:hypothetical protein
LYDATWREFRREFGLAGGSTRRAAGWAADLWFRQKASLLRVAGTAAFADDLLAAGEQVAISVAYLETGALLAETLRGRRWRVCETNGARTAELNEAAALAFKPATATPWCSRWLSRSPSIGANCRAGISLAPSSFMTCATAPFSFSKSRGVAIAMGNVRWLLCFAEETVEERIAATVVTRMAAMDGMAGDDTSIAD